MGLSSNIRIETFDFLWVAHEMESVRVNRIVP
jgi:hypothetical protein